MPNYLRSMCGKCILSHKNTVEIVSEVIEVSFCFLSKFVF